MKTFKISGSWEDALNAIREFRYFGEDALKNQQQCIAKKTFDPPLVLNSNDTVLQEIKVTEKGWELGDIKILPRFDPPI